jgi:myo-inositol-1(or 4)-monophosphatase
MEPTLTEIIQWAKEAGQILREGYGQVHQVTNKGAIDLVTEIDQRSEDFLTAKIQQKYPQHSIVGEENGIQRGNSGGLTWYIDPLDGTSNYVHGLPMFSVSIAFSRQGKTELGVVYDPMMDECFSAQRGRGAFLNERPIHTSQVQELLQAMLVTGFPYDVHDSHTNIAEFTNFVLTSQAVRRLGSAALDICYVANGRLDGYWEFKMKPWDVAAGILILEEAGGKATLMDGSELQLTPLINVLAANPLLHPKMVEVLAKSR